MAFIEIQPDSLTGQSYVSEIDSDLKTFKQQVIECFKTISGYPHTPTSAVMGWTDSTRPSANNSNGNYLIGYNTSSKLLEVINPNGSNTNLMKAFALFVYPVGSYYETSDASFNPNTEWGGTWVKMTDGRFLISPNSKRAIGNTGGEEDVTLTLPQIPTHYHPHKHYHTHTRGTMNITGRFHPGKSDTKPGGGAYHGRYEGAFGLSSDSYSARICDRDSDSSAYYITFDASKAWSGETSNSINGGQYITNSSSYPCAMVDFDSVNKMRQGGGKSHNNMPPYLVVNRWHRTA